jgi:catalase (peroxidase I)
MRHEPESKHEANAGLHIARERLEKVKQKFPGISYGDLWTLAGVVAVQEMVSHKTYNEYPECVSNRYLFL